MYFNFSFILPSVPRFSVKKSVNQLIKNKWPKQLKINIITNNCLNVTNQTKFSHMSANIKEENSYFM